MAKARLPPGHFLDLGTFRPGDHADRPVHAYVPSTYDGATPNTLLVMFDGQNVFGDEGSYAGGWHAHTAVDEMTAKNLRPPIVVAVHNGGESRIREMGHDVRQFAADVANLLLPQLANRFHLTGASGRVVAGSSLGGLAALVCHFNHPEAFGGCIAMSPSLWFNRRAHHRDLATRDIPRSARIYIDAGKRERGQMFADAEQLALHFQNQGDPSIMWRPDARGVHHEAHWRRRLPKALRFAFTAPRVDKGLAREASRLSP